MVEPPPIPRREEDRVVYAGVAPEGWDMEMPRQADESTEELMDPPVPVKDPYGWLRDDERKNKEVLQHLEASLGQQKPVQKGETPEKFFGSNQRHRRRGERMAD